jgi:hypothetical protein
LAIALLPPLLRRVRNRECGIRPRFDFFLHTSPSLDFKCNAWSLSAPVKALLSNFELQLTAPRGRCDGLPLLLVAVEHEAVNPLILKRVRCARARFILNPAHTPTS